MSSCECTIVLYDARCISRLHNIISIASRIRFCEAASEANLPRGDKGCGLPNTRLVDTSICGRMSEAFPTSLEDDGHVGQLKPRPSYRFIIFMEASAKWAHMLLGIDSRLEHYVLTHDSLLRLGLSY